MSSLALHPDVVALREKRKKHPSCVRDLIQFAGRRATEHAATVAVWYSLEYKQKVKYIFDAPDATVGIGSCVQPYYSKLILLKFRVRRYV